MSMSYRTTGLAADASAQLEEIVERFERAWQRGERPAPDHYAPADGPFRRAVLRELVCIHLEYRLKAGEAVTAETYLEHYPELQNDLGVALDLILAEWELRCHREGPVPFAEYARRLRQIREAWAAGPAPTLPAAEGKGEGAPTVPDAAPAARPADTALPSVPGYEIVSELGQGGMGVVYRARQIGLNRVVALKMLAPGREAGPEYRARFRTEAEAAARLQHPNLLQVYEVGEHLGRPFFSMEYADGGTLAKQTAGVPQPPQDAGALVEVLARVMHYAHQKGVLHRDLKPANVLRAADGTPKIADFGLARQFDDDTGQARTGMLPGTPGYMAPEQAGGRVKDLGPWTDVWALGTILYELLTGRPPFQGATVVDTLDQVRAQEVVPPRRLQPKVPRDLETVCLKCLEKAPRRRYATALDLAEDLRRFRAGEPIRARPVGALGRAAKWARRRPAVAALAALLMVVAVAAFGLVTWEGRRTAAALAETAAAHRTRDEALRDAADAGAQARSARTAADEEQRRAAEAGRKADEARALAERSRQDAAAAQKQAEEARRAREKASQDAARQRELADAARAQQAALNYSRHLAAAQREWARGNLGRAADLLAECPEEARGWEWHYLQRLCHGGRRSPPGHAGPDGLLLPAGKVCTAVGFSADSRRLAVASGGDGVGDVRVWDLPDDREAVRLRRGVPGVRVPDVRLVAFDPSGKQVVTADASGMVRLWDALTGDRASLLGKHTGVATSLGFSRDGQCLALLALLGDPERGPGEVLAWEKDFRRPPLRFTGFQTAVVHRDSKRVATADEQAVRLGSLWFDGQLPALAELGKPAALAFSPDGMRLAVGGADGAVRIAAQDRLGRTLTAGRDAVTALAFSTDGTLLAAGDHAGTLRLWDLATGQPPRSLPGHQAAVTHLVFSPARDGTRLLSGDAGGVVRLWDAKAGRQLLALEGRPDPARTVCFSPDGKRLASASGGGAVKVWDADSGEEVLSLEGPGTAVQSVTFSPDGRWLVAVGEGGAVSAWDARPPDAPPPQPNSR
jgi:WD40 repeat protein